MKLQGKRNSRFTKLADDQTDSEATSPTVALEKGEVRHDQAKCEIVKVRPQFSKATFKAIKNGSSGIHPIGFSVEDMFVYEGQNLKSPVDWRLFTPWKRKAIK